MATEKKKLRMPKEFRLWLEKRGLTVMPLPDSQLGGVARWEGVPAKERSRLNTLASRKAAAMRTAAAQERREKAAVRNALRVLRKARKG